MKVYLDGKLIDANRAKLSIQDAAIQHGVGLFETMRAYHGQVFRLNAHMNRLVASAGELGLTDRLEPGPLAEAVELTLARNELKESRIRLTLTGGDMNLLSGARAGGGSKGKGRARRHRPSVVIVAGLPAHYPPAVYEQGVAVVIADPKANPFEPSAGHKTVSYWTRLRSLTVAAASGAGEALWFSVSNHLCGGAVSNAILVKGGQLLTPIARGEEPDGALRSPVLPGITRAAVLEIAERLNLPVHRKMLSINDVLEADELMLTNSSFGVMPVVRVEKERVGAGVVGPVTQQLRAELSAMIESECGKGSPVS